MDLKLALKQSIFRWLPKHLNHIAENIVIKKKKYFIFIYKRFVQTERLQGIECSHAICRELCHQRICSVTAKRSVEKSG